MSAKETREQRKKKQESILEQQILAIMQACLKKAMDQALDELLKDWK